MPSIDRIQAFADALNALGTELERLHPTLCSARPLLCTSQSCADAPANDAERCRRSEQAEETYFGRRDSAWYRYAEQAYEGSIAMGELLNDAFVGRSPHPPSISRRFGRGLHMVTESVGFLLLMRVGLFSGADPAPAWATSISSPAPSRKPSSSWRKASNATSTVRPHSLRCDDESSANTCGTKPLTRWESVSFSGLGTEHVRAAYAHHALAEAYFQNKQLDKAKEAATEAVRLRQKCGDNSLSKSQDLLQKIESEA